MRRLLANDDTYTTPFETRLRVGKPGFLANDIDIVGEAEARCTTPTHGKLNWHDDGRIDYEPDDGFTGTDHFDYQLTTLLPRARARHGSRSSSVRSPRRSRRHSRPRRQPRRRPRPDAEAHTGPHADAGPTPTPRPTPVPTPRPSSIPPLPTLEPLPSLDVRPTPTPGPSGTRRRPRPSRPLRLRRRRHRPQDPTRRRRPAGARSDGPAARTDPARRGAWPRRRSPNLSIGAEPGEGAASARVPRAGRRRPRPVARAGGAGRRAGRPRPAADRSPSGAVARRARLDAVRPPDVRRRRSGADRPPATPDVRLGARPTRWYPAPRRGGRAVDGGALEKRRVERLRGFESHPLRQRSPGRARSRCRRPLTSIRASGCARRAGTARVVTSKRGSEFRLCERSRTDPAFPALSGAPRPALRRLRGDARADRRPGLDASAEPRPYSAPTSRRTGCERDEYPSHVDPETRWLVRTGTTTTGNGPGSLRTERGGSPPVGSGAERQRYRAAPIGDGGDTIGPSVT